MDTHVFLSNTVDLSIFYFILMVIVYREPKLDPTC